MSKDLRKRIQTFEDKLKSACMGTPEAKLWVSVAVEAAWNANGVGSNLEYHEIHTANIFLRSERFHYLELSGISSEYVSRLIKDLDLLPDDGNEKPRRAN